MGCDSMSFGNDDYTLYITQEKSNEEAVDIEVQKLRKQLKKVESEIVTLKAKRTKLETAIKQLDFEKYSENVGLLDSSAVTDRLFNNGIVLIAQSGDRVWIKSDCDWTDNFYGIYYDNGYTLNFCSDEIAKYSTLKQFKAVIQQLVNAIECGDEEFTFPADTVS